MSRDSNQKMAARARMILFDSDLNEGVSNEEDVRELAADKAEQLCYDEEALREEMLRIWENVEMV